MSLEARGAVSAGGSAGSPAAALPWRRLVVDAGAVSALGAVLFWLPVVHGGRSRGTVSTIALLVLLGTPAVVEGLRGTRRVERALLGVFGIALLVHPFLGGYRDLLDGPLLRYATVPLLYLIARYAGESFRGAWPWILAAAGIWMWSRGWSGWIDPPDDLFAAWRVLPWHNPSGIVCGAFGVLGLVASAGPAGRWWYTPLGALGLSGLWLSASRASIAMTALVVIGALAVSLRTPRGLARVATTLVGAAVLTWGLVQVSPVFSGERPAVLETGQSVRDGVGSPLGARTASTGNLRARVLHIEAALEMFRRSPLTGAGLGAYEHEILEVASPAMNYTRSAHSEPIEVLGEGGLLLGVPFAALFLGAVAGALATAVRRRREPFAAGAAWAAALVLGHSMFDIDWAYLYVPGLCAILLGYSRADDRAEPHPERTNAWPVLGLVASLALAVGLVVEITVAGDGRPALWHADPHFDSALDALAAGQIAQASEAATRANVAAPGSSSSGGLSRVASLAVDRDRAELRELAFSPGSPLLTALFATAALIGLEDDQADAAIRHLDARTGAYHPERVGNFLEDLARLRDAS